MRKQAARIILISAIVLSAAILLVSAGFLLAQSGYNLGWWTADGGGGISVGGDYAVAGTIGQPDAGTSSGGPYQLDGGFWPAAGAPPDTVGNRTYLPVVRR